MRLYVHDEEGQRQLDVEDAAVFGEVLEVEEDVSVWLEDADEPTTLRVRLREVFSGRVGHVHLSRHPRIAVVVTYNGAERSREFGPGSTVERVFNWAVGKHGFKLDDSAAAELVLRLHDSDEDLDTGTHIGTLAARGTELALNLLPAERFAG